jgi:peptide/nickel transport system permease protein
MTKKIASKVLFMILTMIVMSVLIFTLVELMPGDVAQVILGMNASEESLAAMRESMGLDRPAVVRYLDWAGNAVQGDFGESAFLKGVSVSSLVLRRGMHSMALAATAFAIFVPVSLLLGVLAGTNEGKLTDKVISYFGIITMAMPEFVIGIFMIMVFSIQLNLFPVSSTLEIGQRLSDNLNILILPALSITLLMVGYISRMQRASMVTVMNSEYIKMARLKGLPRSYVIRHHAVKNALIPSITVIGMNMGWLFGGLVVVESLFDYPGIGLTVVQAIRSRDVPLILASILLITLVYIISSFVTDLLYVYVNPRIRFGGE